MTESFVIQADIANMPAVEERLFHFCRECNVGNYYSAVSVATMQAVENAIVHGSGSNADKQVAAASSPRCRTRARGSISLSSVRCLLATRRWGRVSL